MDIHILVVDNVHQHACATAVISQNPQLNDDKKEISMRIRSSILLLLAVVLGSIALQGCRHAAKTAAVVPSVVPPKATASASVPVAKVVSPAEDFKGPATAAESTPDPAAETLLAEKKGWIRDAFFPYDSAVITPESQENLGTTAQWLRNHGAYHVMIEGHCDERGTEQYNLALGDKRAYDAREYLATLGIDTKRMSTISYGKEKPFDEGHDEAAWAKNRRAHVVLTSASK
jgi:peptidoglycan-associated lipoprotein